VLPRGENLVRAEWTPEEILDVLRERGVERLLIEGGGGLLGPFLAKGRVDRLHLTLCPQVLGGDQGLAGPMRWTFAQAPRMRLTACEPVGDEVYVTYERA
jgi:riboflavin biosynthesis pyrimidine reductase